MQWTLVKTKQQQEQRINSAVKIQGIILALQYVFGASLS